MEVFCLCAICFYYKSSVSKVTTFPEWKSLQYIFKKAYGLKAKLNSNKGCIRNHWSCAPLPHPLSFQSIPCTYMQPCQPINRDSIMVFCYYYLILTELKSTICVPPKLLLTLCPHWEIPFKTHLFIHALVPLTLPPMHPCSIIYIHVSFSAFFFCLWLLSHEFLFLCLKTF